MAVTKDLQYEARLIAPALAALEKVLGDEAILTVGEPRTDAPIAEITPPDVARLLAIQDRSEGTSRCHVMLVSRRLWDTLVRSMTTEEATSVLGDTLRAVTTTTGGNATDPVEISLEDLTSGPGSCLAAIPVLEGGEPLAVFVVSDNLAGLRAPADAADVSHQTVPHEFASIAHSGSIPRGLAHGLDLIQDVEMEITVVLGRAVLTVRELLSLEPGSVVELDQAAGSPVEVLVNGTTIARGEVVVIDEVFGIRITEIVGGNER
jgi:flagellar motor switch protein FliN/FliY